jgi:hypothetical protein
MLAELLQNVSQTAGFGGHEKSLLFGRERVDNGEAIVRGESARSGSDATRPSARNLRRFNLIAHCGDQQREGRHVAAVKSVD